MELVHPFCVAAVMLSQKKERKEKPRFGKKKFGPDERMAFAARKEMNGERVTCQVVLWVWSG